MDDITIQRQGGLANLPASASLSINDLSAGDRAALEDLFKRKQPLPQPPGGDMYTYHITLRGADGAKTISVPQALMPEAIANTVKDTLPGR